VADRFQQELHHFVQRRWHSNAKRIGGFHIDDQLETSWGPKRRPSLARRLTKMHGSDGATGNLMTAPGQNAKNSH
jgi:hypothetical protein